MTRSIAERNEIIPTLGEIFRERGFPGTSLSEITQRTGLGKGSLYHFFPEGKNEMAATVLDDVASWFENNVFLPLREDKNPKLAIKMMFEAIDDYFYSGERICLVGAFALDDTRDKFAKKINAYFYAWNDALIIAFKHHGLNAKKARENAEDIVASIQGALILSRSLDDPKVFTRVLNRLQKRVAENACG